MANITFQVATLAGLVPNAAADPSFEPQPAEESFPWRLRLKLAAADEVALIIHGLRAYPQGLRFRLTVRFPPQEPVASGVSVMYSLMHGRSARRNAGGLRFGVQYRDGVAHMGGGLGPSYTVAGRVVTIEPKPDDSAAGAAIAAARQMAKGRGGAHLRTLAGHYDNGVLDQDFWAWPHPASAQIVFFGEWPDRRVPYFEHPVRLGARRDGSASR